MRRFLFVSSVFFLLPCLALAAGFAKQSLFLSQASVTEGETVFVYAVVTNDTVNTFSGTLKLSDEDGSIGSTPVSLKPSVAATVSVTWKPTAGEHVVTANLVSTDGTVAESEESTFTINPKPSPASPQSAQVEDTTPAPINASSTIDSSAPLQKTIASLSPQVGSYTKPVLGAIDSGRSAAAKSLSSGTNWSKQELLQTSKASGGFGNTLWMILATLVLYVCTALTYAVSNIGIFYPAFAILFFFILWRIFRHIRRR